MLTVQTSLDFKKLDPLFDPISTIFTGVSWTPGDDRRSVSSPGVSLFTDRMEIEGLLAPIGDSFQHIVVLSHGFWSSMPD